MGMIAKKYPSSINDPEEFLQKLVNQLNEEVLKTDSSLPLIMASFEAISNFFYSFPTVEDESVLETIFKCILKTIETEPGHKKTHCRGKCRIVQVRNEAMIS